MEDNSTIMYLVLKERVSFFECGKNVDAQIKDEASRRQKAAVLESWKLAREAMKLDLRRLGGTVMKSGKESEQERQERERGRGKM